MKYEIRMAMLLFSFFYLGYFLGDLISQYSLIIYEMLTYAMVFLLSIVFIFWVFQK